ncbi:HPP family protein [Phlyctema vagabunda]|uniref:HPP family protein n=1 Tax=Phlyctema vagabunda TaxID=108571 RepID=A0ABR4PN19_9HELO
MSSSATQSCFRAVSRSSCYTVYKQYTGVVEVPESPRLQKSFLFSLLIPVMSTVAWDFDVDHHLNRFVPRPRLYLLPKPVSWILGYRSAPRPPVGRLLVCFWSFIGAFAALSTIERVFRTAPIRAHEPPIIIASFGAAVILEFNAIDGPLAQPRNAFFGQLFSSVIGVGITKLFAMSSDFDDLRWLAGSLSVGLASAVMAAANVVYPPAGATALLCATNPIVTKMGWFLVPLVLLGNVLMLAIACVINNIQRTFPAYWWTATNLSAPRDEDIEKTSDIDDTKEKDDDEIIVTRGHINTPNWLALSAEEKEILHGIQIKLQHGLTTSNTSDTDQTHVD